MIKNSPLALVLVRVASVVLSIARADEPYREVDLSDLPFVLSGAASYYEVDADECVVKADLMVKEFSLDGREIELESDKLRRVGCDLFILTENHGKVKVTFDSNANPTLWLTSSQLKNFKAWRSSVPKE